MKILLILLGCLAFANAGFSSYYYRRGCYSTPSCYRFNVYSCAGWFTTKYYSGVLKAYPDETCEVKAWDVLKSDCEAKLLTKRTEIEGEINTRFEDWKAKLLTWSTAQNTRVATYWTDCYADRIQSATDEGDTTRADELTTERDQKISDAQAAIAQSKADAEQKYSDAITATMEKIEEFHDQLIVRFGECYTTRSTKLTEFNGKIDTRVTEYETKYREALEAMVGKRRETFKNLLLKICDSDAEATALSALYEPTESIDDLVEAYRTKLLENAQKLKDYYSCAYKCFGGCVTFYKRNYFGYCSRLGQWWCYSLRYTVPCARYVKFTYKWNKPTYRSLKSCDPLVENETRDTVYGDMETKIATAMSETRTSCETYFSELETKHAECVTRYRQCIEERHTAIINSRTECLKALREDRVLTTEDEQTIADLTSELAAKVDPAVNAYEQKLLEQRTAARTTTKTSITEYETKLTEFATTIADNYQTCLDAFTTKKTEYEGKLDVMIAKRRTCLEDNLNKMIERNVKCAEGIIKAWIGETKMTDGAVTAFTGGYRTKLEGERDTTLGEFDTFWTTQKPLLAAHYACCLRCRKVTFCVRPWVQPRCWSYKVCYPTYKTYTYCARWYYTRYYHKTIGGHYYCH